MTADRRWPWFAQVREAVVASLGVGILATMTVRDSWPPIGVIAALVCVGQVSAAAFTRYLLGRVENGGGEPPSRP
jgi:hypothetical protein